MKFRNKRPRNSRQMPLKCKYWYRGMSKTNYRKQGTKNMFQINGIEFHQNVKDITGQRFGKLVALYPTSKRGRHRGIVWKWQCDCGNTIESISHDIAYGHKNSCGCLRGIERGESSFNLLYNSYKASARKRKISFELSKDLFRVITKQNCYYCGAYPSNVRTQPNLKGEYVYNGVDRLNSKKGYIDGNVVPCCGMCNTMKMDYGFSDFLSKIKTIYLKHSTSISLLESEI